MKKIILTTLNSRYSHTSIALRYLYANMKELQSETKILEFVINENVQSVAEKILDESPDIIGIGVYIWNAADVHDLLEIIKKVSPQTQVILGGPEAGYLPHRVNFDKADYIVQGEGDLLFYEICDAILNANPPEERIIKAPMVDLKKVELPYAYYSDNDVQNRHIYVEASRGCPFLCEFCLSAIDEKVRSFDLDVLLKEFEILWQRGARNFKFIDRTFNLNIKTANRLMDFFLSKAPPYFAHFEVVPDHFPDSLKERISKFPPASLQLEVGIQTLDSAIAANISRPLKMDKIRENLAYLENETNAHMHVDLIVGLPGETLEGFGKNLNVLSSLVQSEIQIGILKKLSGTTMNRHDREAGMVYSDKPPYDVLKTGAVSFKEIQRMKRFARFWDLIYNSGNFTHSIVLLWENDTVFDAFFAFSEWIYLQTASTWKISLERLAKLFFDYLTSEKGMEEERVAASMISDFMKVKGRKLPVFLKGCQYQSDTSEQVTSSTFNKRQIRHDAD